MTSLALSPTPSARCPLSLPSEIWLRIFEYVRSDSASPRKSFYKICLVNRHLNNLGTPILYKSIVVVRQEPGDEEPVLRKLLRTLREEGEGGRLGGLIREGVHSEPMMYQLGESEDDYYCSEEWSHEGWVEVWHEKAEDWASGNSIIEKDNGSKEERLEIDKAGLVMELLGKAVGTEDVWLQKWGAQIGVMGDSVRGQQRHPKLEKFWGDLFAPFPSYSQLTALRFVSCDVCFASLPPLPQLLTLVIIDAVVFSLPLWALYTFPSVTALVIAPRSEWRESQSPVEIMWSLLQGDKLKTLETGKLSLRALERILEEQKGLEMLNVGLTFESRAYEDRDVLEDELWPKLQLETPKLPLTSTAIRALDFRLHASLEYEHYAEDLDKVRTLYQQLADGGTIQSSEVNVRLYSSTYDGTDKEDKAKECRRLAESALGEFVDKMKVTASF